MNLRNSGSNKRVSMAQYSHVTTSPLPASPRTYRKLHLCEVAHMVMRVEVRTIEFWRAVISECLGTMFYVMLGCSSTLTCDHSSTAHDKDQQVGSVLFVSLTFGCTMATLVQCFGHISGAHFNPVVSLAMTLTCKVTPLRGLLYCLAHLGGAIAGAALLYGITPSTCPKDLGLSQPVAGLTVWQALAIELLLTFLYVFAIFATIDPNRKELGSKALAIGIALGLAHLAGFRFTGSSMNPARSLGPAFVMNTWKHHWVYWAGPLAGGLTSGLLYEYIFDPSRGRRRPKMPEEPAPFQDLEEDELSVPTTTQTPTSNHVTHTYGNQGGGGGGGTYGNHVIPGPETSPSAPPPSESEAYGPPCTSAHGAQLGRRTYKNYLPVDTNPDGMENAAYSFDTGPRRVPPPPPPRREHLHLHTHAHGHSHAHAHAHNLHAHAHGPPAQAERGEEILLDDVRGGTYAGRQG